MKVLLTNPIMFKLALLSIMLMMFLLIGVVWIYTIRKRYLKEARGIAVNRPRSRYKVPPDPQARGYLSNAIMGAVPSFGVAALRYDSVIVQERVTFGQRRLDWLHPSRRSWGFVMLFSLETGEPLAIIQDFGLSPLRVGATTGMAERTPKARAS
jgi:ornithine cyclodeaminase/alanine dehydrogenase-like protein (mu-crystallin family)